MHKDKQKMHFPRKNCPSRFKRLSTLFGNAWHQCHQWARVAWGEEGVHWLSLTQ